MPNLRRYLLRAIIVCIMLIGGYLAYIAFIQPDPLTLLRVRATNTAREAIMNQDWDTALSTIEQANISVDHQNWELLTWYAVLSEKSSTNADDIMEQALVIGEPEEVWITYGMVAILVDEPAMILRAGQELIDDNADSVQGYYLMAQAYDVRKDFDKALQYYDSTLDKIDLVGGNEGIYIVVRQRVAQINIELMGQELTSDGQ